MQPRETALMGVRIGGGAIGCPYQYVLKLTMEREGEIKEESSGSHCADLSTRLVLASPPAPGALPESAAYAAASTQAS